ncbi:unnamed protein product, partial [Amoebophrya sp. A120]|eukprot:GSA120T00025279001.1
MVLSMLQRGESEEERERDSNFLGVINRAGTNANHTRSTSTVEGFFTQPAQSGNNFHIGRTIQNTTASSQLVSSPPQHGIIFRTTGRQQESFLEQDQQRRGTTSTGDGEALTLPSGVGAGENHFLGATS